MKNKISVFTIISLICISFNLYSQKIESASNGIIFTIFQFNSRSEKLSYELINNSDTTIQICKPQIKYSTPSSTGIIQKIEGKEILVRFSDTKGVFHLFKRKYNNHLESSFVIRPHSSKSGFLKIKLSSQSNAQKGKCEIAVVLNCSFVKYRRLMYVSPVFCNKIIKSNFIDIP